MVNFRKMYDDWWNTLPKERQEEILRVKALEKEHLYYETSTLLDDEYGATPKEEKRDVQLYRPVQHDGSLRDTILLSFGGYCEYAFDKRFCLKMLHDLRRNKERRLCIDAGRSLYVKNAEVLRIFKESIEALVARNIEMVDDYYPGLSASDMGKMLNEMGLR